MDTKIVAGLVAAALAIGFFGGTIVGESKAMDTIRNTPPVVTRTIDTLWQESDPVYLPGIPGVIDTLRRIDTLYSWDITPDVVARMDTVLPPHGDTLGVEYHIPWNVFDITYAPGLMKIPRETVTNTVTVIERRFFLGPYFKVVARSPWYDGFMTLSKMDFDFGGGFAFQVDKFQVDLEPINLHMINSQGSVGFGVSVRYYPWAN